MESDYGSMIWNLTKLRTTYGFLIWDLIKLRISDLEFDKIMDRLRISDLRFDQTTDKRRISDLEIDISTEKLRDLWSRMWSDYGQITDPWACIQPSWICQVCWCLCLNLCSWSFSIVIAFFFNTGSSGRDRWDRGAAGGRGGWSCYRTIMMIFVVLLLHRWVGGCQREPPARRKRLAWQGGWGSQPLRKKS